MNRLDDLIRFYRILGNLETGVEGKRQLDDCHGRMDWPTRGVYFFFEKGEVRSDSGDGLRVVRVGTHALKPGSRTTLWNRLSQHRGTLSTGAGNHRGSIFRLIVGDALTVKDKIEIQTWGVGSDAGMAGRKLGITREEVNDLDRPMELAVSHVIREMPFLWLDIPDDSGPASQRGYIERNAIALLSNYAKEPLDVASPDWLGNYSSRKKVRQSGLWNSNHVDEAYDLDFMDVLESCAEKTVMLD